MTCWCRLAYSSVGSCDTSVILYLLLMTGVFSSLLKTMDDEIGLPTSCQYFHVWSDDKKKDAYDVNAYFIHRGLGVAHPPKHMDGVTFFGYAYSTHCTSFCYLTATTEVSPYAEDIFSMVTWGTSEGSSEYQRATGIG
jgi:hypothetical protein